MKAEIELSADDVFILCGLYKKLNLWNEYMDASFIILALLRNIYAQSALQVDAAQTIGMALDEFFNGKKDSGDNLEVSQSML